jgi:adenine-specific DNA-methyltransferase
MDKLKMQTPNKVNENVEKIAALFPNCVTEAIGADGEPAKSIDFDLLRQELSGFAVEGTDERYQFTWADKKESILRANSPISKTLRPCREESVNFDTTQNLYIEGDNLDVLKLLQETYMGKIKMIYIDPPYNTGNDFVYEDDFAMSAEEYLEMSGAEDENGNRLFQNNDSNGRFHTDWLNMIYPRLKLARDLLTDDGVIFISIDDNEVHNLRKICDEIFGARNFETQIAWRRRHNQPNDKTKMVAKVSENILVYAKNSIVLSNNKAYHRLPLTPERVEEYRNPDNDSKGRWSSNPWKAAVGRGGTKYTIITPTGKKHTETWYGNNSSFEALLSEGRVHWTDNGDGLPRIKIYLDDAMREGQAAINFFTHERFGSNQEGSNELENLFDVKGLFDKPKPIKLIKALTILATNESSIILDFFSGSGTTAHAIMQLNAEDEGNRKFVLVQLPEKTPENSEARKAGYNNICEIGKERIRRAGQKMVDENRLTAPNLDIGFRVLKLDSSNMKPVFYTPEEVKQDTISMFESNIKEDRTPEDLLFQVMLDIGVDLSSTITVEDVDGKKIFTVGSNNLICCFDEGITKDAVTEIAKRHPLYAVFRDSCFESDDIMVSFDQIFETCSSTTTRKVI